MATTAELEAAHKIGKMEEAIQASREDRRDIWSALNDLRKIASQNETILSLLNELSKRFEAHEERTDARIRVLETGHAQAGGAMKVVIGFAAIIGAAISSIITFMFTHAFSSGK